MAESNRLWMDPGSAMAYDDPAPGRTEIMPVSEHKQSLESITEELERRAKVAKQIANGYMAQGVPLEHEEVVSAESASATWRAAANLIRKEIGET